jgi:alpha-L-fucosidase 2
MVSIYEVSKRFDRQSALENYDDKSWKKMTVPSYEGWEAVGFED